MVKCIKPVHRSSGCSGKGMDYIKPVHRDCGYTVTMEWSKLVHRDSGCTVAMEWITLNLCKEVLDVQWQWNGFH